MHVIQHSIGHRAISTTHMQLNLLANNCSCFKLVVETTILYQSYKSLLLLLFWKF